MIIAIPSAGRHHLRGSKHTAFTIPKRWRESTFIFCPSDEMPHYRRLAAQAGIAGVLADRCGGRSISRTRINIARFATDKFMMLDDDLSFYIRDRGSIKPRLRDMSDRELDGMFNRVAKDLDKHSHVGISHREGNNHMPLPHVYNVRCTRAVAFRRDAYLENRPTLGIMEDFDVALQLLTQGHAFKVWTLYAQNQRGTNLQGGCSRYRSLEAQAKAARALAEKFPEFVKIREKHTRGGLGDSLDVTVYWKKAYESSNRP